VWTAARLRELIARAYRGESVIVLANRAPFQCDFAPDGSIIVKRSSGGLVTALEPVMEACAGVWIAGRSGSAGRNFVDGSRARAGAAANRSYRVRHVSLDPHEERGYYYGFANEGLWPLCHRTGVRPVFRRGDFNAYRAVNGAFADAACEEAASDRPLVLVQDYHFALVPRMIRERLPLARAVSFWHIPWPRPRDFAACPCGRQLVEGLLGASVVGFQTEDDCRNFIDTVECTLDADIDRERNTIAYEGRRTAIRAYPVSVEWPSRWARQSSSVAECRAEVSRRLGLPADVRLAVGVDRLDYTKGIVEKFLAAERLLASHPEFRGRFVLVQLAEPSRECLPSYRELRSRVRDTADCINARFGGNAYRPIVLLEAHHQPADVYRFLRAADVCYVGSLHDGMNLVAKEFVSARDDERGVLVLSGFAGAARELSAAMIVNPYAIDDAARALAGGLNMPDADQSTRMRAMRSVIAQHNSYTWAGKMLTDAAFLDSAVPSVSNTADTSRHTSPEEAVR